jgi:hypothetical protein
MPRFGGDAEGQVRDGDPERDGGDREGSVLALTPNSRGSTGCMM